MVPRPPPTNEELPQQRNNYPASTALIETDFSWRSGTTPEKTRKQFWEIAEDLEKLRDYDTTLDDFQRHSLALIREWMAARRDELHFEADASAELSRALQLRIKRESGDVGLALATSSGNLSEVRPTGRIGYHFWLIQLTCKDFTRVRSNNSSKYLWELRIFAPKYAACHRLSSLYYNSIAGRPQESSQRWHELRPQYGAPIVSKIELQSDGLKIPHYHWDIQRRKTLTHQEIVDELGTAPEYVAVSHSWGRYVDDESPWVGVTGVSWKIPMNSMFNVEDLPYHISKFGSRYVWLDLLVISQGLTLEKESRMI